MECVAFVDMFFDAFVGLFEEFLVEVVSEAFACFVEFLLYFLVVFSDLVLDEYVGAVSFLGVSVVDERVVESVDVSGCFPDGRVHEDAGVEADDVLVEHGHGFPPVFLDVIFEFDAVLSVVVDGA